MRILVHKYLNVTWKMQGAELHVNTSRNISFSPYRGNICSSRVTLRSVFTNVGYYYAIIGAYEEITDRAVLGRDTRPCFRKLESVNES